MRSSITKLGFISALSISLFACSGGGGGSPSSPEPISTKTLLTDTPYFISGSIQKGPFAINSDISIYALSEFGQLEDTEIDVETTDNLGNYSFTIENTETVRITANGYFRNEINGGLSSIPMSLNAIYHLDSDTRPIVNVNVLTHLASSRVIQLLKKDITFDSAIGQAEKELLENLTTLLPPDTYSTFTSLNLFNSEAGEGSAFLVALSSIFYQAAITNSRSSFDTISELNSLLDALTTDFSVDGEISRSEEMTRLRMAATAVDPNKVMIQLKNFTSFNANYSVVDINNSLDSDLDGITNLDDEDDDNDNLKDEIDLLPTIPSFLKIEAISLTTSEDSTGIDFVIDINNPRDEAVNVISLVSPRNGKLSGEFPAFNYKPNKDFFGGDSLQIQFVQQDVISEPITINITVEPNDDIPIISGSPVTTLDATQLYRFQPIVINVDSDTLMFSVENKPDWIEFDNQTGLFTGTPLNKDAGIYENIKISVSDATSTISLKPFTLEVEQTAWQLLTSITLDKQDAAAAATDNKIYLTGGVDGRDGTTAEVEVFNLDTQSWSQGLSLSFARSSHTSVTLNEEIYVIGGLSNSSVDNVEAFNPETGRWSDKASLQISRFGHASCVYDGRIYTFGGTKHQVFPANTDRLDSVEVYDPTTNQWTDKTKMPDSNYEMECVTFADKIYLFGGMNHRGSYFTYDPNDDEWEVTDMPRHYPWGYSTMIHDSKIMIIGGFECNSFGSSCSYSTNVRTFDPSTGIWDEKPDMPIKQVGAASVAYEEVLYMVGGIGGKWSPTRLNLFNSYYPIFDN